jgi:hypothetical protein
MNSIDFALRTAETRIKFAIPNPVLWSGAASMACAESIEYVVHDLQLLQQRLSECLW